MNYFLFAGMTTSQLLPWAQALVLKISAIGADAVASMTDAEYERHQWEMQVSQSILRKDAEETALRRLNKESEFLSTTRQHTSSQLPSRTKAVDLTKTGIPDSNPWFSHPSVEVSACVLF